MRPLIAAEPILRAPNPEMVSESTFTGRGVCAVAVPHMKRTRPTMETKGTSFRIIDLFLALVFFNGSVRSQIFIVLKQTIFSQARLGAKCCVAPNGAPKLLASCVL